MTRGIGILVLAGGWAAWGQTFEVASVRRSSMVAGEQPRTGIATTPTGLTARRTSLAECIEWAWRARSWEVAGPDWIHTEKWDIAAKTGQPTSADDLRAMMRALVEERFAARLRREKKEMAVYALVVGRHGAKLKPSTHETAGMEMLPGGGLRLEFHRTSTAELANFLSTLAVMDRPVEDRTGLDGVFDFPLDLHEVAGPWGSDAERNAAPSMGTVIEEQLGLKLEGRRAAVEMLVVERASRPEE